MARDSAGAANFTVGPLDSPDPIARCGKHAIRDRVGITPSRGSDVRAGAQRIVVIACGCVLPLITFAWSLVEGSARTPRMCGGPSQGTVSQLRSDALENFRASHPCRAAIWSDVCRDPTRDNASGAHKTSIPDRGRSAICRPVP
jgi:hypothetical protein